jgi:hypothetical protein
MSQTEDTSFIREIQSFKDVVIDITKDGIITLSESITVILSLIILYKSFADKGKDVITFISRERIEEQAYINSLLREFLGVTQCHRICIGIFHNGTKAGSIHFRKMSIVYEALSHGVSSIKNKVQSKSIIEFEDEILKYSDSEFTRYSIEDSDIKPECRKHLDFIGVHTIYSRLLSIKKGGYGIMQLQFIDKPDFEIFNTLDKIQSAEKIFNKISTALDYIAKGKKIPIS